MGSDDYSAAVSGGLKLKGSKPSGVTKKKKKSKPKDTDDSKATATQSTLADEERAAAAESSAGATGAQEGDGNEEEEYEPSSSKTEAERKYEDMRRKRVRAGFPQVSGLDACMRANGESGDSSMSALRKKA
jgi:protein FAM32A